MTQLEQLNIKKRVQFLETGILSSTERLSRPAFLELLDDLRNARIFYSIHEDVNGYPALTFTDLGKTTVYLEA